MAESPPPYFRKNLEKVDGSPEATFTYANYGDACANFVINQKSNNWEIEISGGCQGSLDEKPRKLVYKQISESEQLNNKVKSFILYDEIVYYIDIWSNIKTFFEPKQHLISFEISPLKNTVKLNIPKKEDQTTFLKLKDNMKMVNNNYMTIHEKQKKILEIIKEKNEWTHSSERSKLWYSQQEHNKKNKFDEDIKELETDVEEIKKEILVLKSTITKLRNKIPMLYQANAADGQAQNISTENKEKKLLSHLVLKF